MNRATIFATTAAFVFACPSFADETSGGAKAEASTTAGSGAMGAEGSGADPALEVQAPADHSKLDTDKNGLVSETEAAARADILASFAALDTNGDGNLDSAEFSKLELKK
jgi:hypothetical protein